MKNQKIAKRLVRIASLIAEDDSADESGLVKIDSSLNAITTKVIDATGGDLKKMLTIILMAMKKTGRTDEIAKIHNLFKQLMKKI